MSTFLLALGIAVLGGCGAVARFAVHSAIVKIDPTEFPLATFTVNIAGSFALGLLVGAGIGHDAYLLLGTGLLGAFTTFSTWMFECERMVADGESRGAFASVVTSTFLGLGAVAIGVAAGGVF